MLYNSDFYLPNGLLGNVEGYEYRAAQQQMADAIYQILDSGHLGIIEAGTGTGKSLAYLYPAICFAKTKQEKVVISTNTLNLQDQLLNKDLPGLRKLGIDFNAVVVRGWVNYPCWARAQDFLFTVTNSIEEKLVTDLIAGLERQEVTTISDCPDFSEELWEEVQAESDLCTRGKCEFYEHCPIFINRRLAEKADLLIVNHHLLLADVSIRQKLGWDTTAVLPSYKHLIIDEAHHIQDVATEYFAVKVSPVRLSRLLGLFYRRRKDRGLLNRIRQQVSKSLSEAEAADIFQLIDWHILPQIRVVDDVGAKFFDELAKYLQERNGADPESLRIPFRQGIETESVLTAYDLLHSNLRKWEIQLEKLLELTESLSEKEGFESLFYLEAYYQRVVDFRVDLEFTMDVNQPGYVYWLKAMERQRGASLQGAPIDVGPLLKENLLFQLSSVIFTSATLSVNQDFTYFRKNVGIDFEEAWDLVTLIFESPFDYQKQVFMAVPKDLPLPDSSNYPEELANKLVDILALTKGRAFVLFTSYKMLKEVAKYLRTVGLEQTYNFLVQGEQSRYILIERFKVEPNPVLLGTDSFWEGVDVAGEALSSVIITKLPFTVPTDPIVMARSELILELGGNPFRDYFLPKAVLKFRQGCGRLIRTKTDRGLLVICDRRIMDRNYGETFIQSLASCSIGNDYLDKLKQEVNLWL